MRPETFMNLSAATMVAVAIYRRNSKSKIDKLFIVATIAAIILCIPLPFLPSFILPKWLELSLKAENSSLHSGLLNWTKHADGFESANLQVFSGNQVVDSISLLRIDPAFFKFSVHFQRENSPTINEWRERLNAVAVVNGSYFDLDYNPATPLWTNGKRLGPEQYLSKHGMFIADEPSQIREFSEKNINEIDTRIKNGMVSYPLLLDENGVVRASGRSEWLANRTFVASDRSGHIILGTTKGGFFSLKALANFIKIAPLDIKIALNLDGGQAACQSVKIGDYEQSIYGQWELRDTSNLVRFIHQSTLKDLENRHHRFLYWNLPIVLAVVKK